MQEYLPLSPENKNAEEYNKNLPSMGGIYNSRNLQTYHYAGNNPLKYVDPTGEMARLPSAGNTQKVLTGVALLVDIFATKGLATLTATVGGYTLDVVLSRLDEIEQDRSNNKEYRAKLAVVKGELKKRENELRKGLYDAGTQAFDDSYEAYEEAADAYRMADQQEQDIKDLKKANPNADTSGLEQRVIEMREAGARHEKRAEELHERGRDLTTQSQR
jgi:hypothetical protein